MEIYNPMEVLQSPREPFNKNTLWISVNKDGIIEGKVFDKSWKVIFTTEDKGLSSLSSEQVQKMVDSIKEELLEIIKKQYSKQSEDSIVLKAWEQKMKAKIGEMEEKLDKLNKRYSMIVTKLNKPTNKNGRNTKVLHG